MPRPKDAMRGSRNAASHDLAQTDGRDRPIRCASLDADEHEDDGFDEVPVDDEFERRVDELVEPMLRLAGARGRMSRLSQIFRDEMTVMVRFESMASRTVGDLIDLGDEVRALLNAVRSGEPDEKVALNLF